MGRDRGAGERTASSLIVLKLRVVANEHGQITFSYRGLKPRNAARLRSMSEVLASKEIAKPRLADGMGIGMSEAVKESLHPCQLLTTGQH